MANYDRKRFSLVQVRLNRGGYDESGQYYGVGQPLYRATNLLKDETKEFRANSRDQAIEKMLSLFPDAPGIKFRVESFYDHEWHPRGTYDDFVYARRQAQKIEREEHKRVHIVETSDEEEFYDQRDYNWRHRA